MHVTHTPASAAKPETHYFVGEVHVQPIVSGDQGLEIAIVRFSPGARTYLHTHHVPQVLHCTEGRGILATKKQQNLVEPGDVVYIAAGEEHWHAATKDSHFVHLSSTR
jgi:quercetin dioxygenase-like cupin family protein